VRSLATSSWFGCPLIPIPGDVFVRTSVLEKNKIENVGLIMEFLWLGGGGGEAARKARGWKKVVDDLWVQQKTDGRWTSGSLAHPHQHSLKLSQRPAQRKEAGEEISAYYRSQASLRTAHGPQGDHSLTCRRVPLQLVIRTLSAAQDLQHLLHESIFLL